ncbi:MAG: hydroxyethylthiazole kinase [Clostridium sp.]|nr:hydroxyethylthiazole kinase [Clostridium sp.]
MFNKILNNVTKTNPLVHCITNYVTVNDCANILLAASSSPVMADDENEVEDITSISKALVINLGTLNTRTINSMIKAGKKANELNHPVILDPVGVGASSFRTSTALTLLREVKFSVIRGNISEIKTLLHNTNTTKGVDANEDDAITSSNVDDAVNIAKALSTKFNTIVAISGPIDVITDGTKTYLVKNGHKLMSKVTGTGCMSTAIIGGFCGANYDNLLEATVTAVCAMGLCGELAYEKIIKLDEGTSSYRTYIIDFMSKMNYNILSGGAKYECR